MMLKLTKRGIAELSRFPHEARQQASHALRYRLQQEPSMTTEQCWKYYCKVCYSYCKERGWRPDNEKAQWLLAQVDKREPFASGVTRPGKSQRTVYVASSRPLDYTYTKHTIEEKKKTAEYQQLPDQLKKELDNLANMILTRAAAEDKGE